ncbi:MAG: FAD-dependent oxidoreductase [Chlamydiia bacterium]|nr:FAD-dependent oxidoreductase [Chlamydiia bacterium]
MKAFQWTVVGAGPAGIAALGKLIDQGVKPLDIAWVDPTFNVGDLGGKWYRVSSNTKVKLFVDFLEECEAFRFQMSPDFKLKHLDPESTCLLGEIRDPLKWVTDHLKVAVHPYESKVHSLELKNQQWKVGLKDEVIYSKNVILAIGSDPKKLNYPSLKEIPIEIALNDEKLEKENLAEDTVAVFGSSHSSIITLQNLLKAKVKKIINFYINPTRYALYMGDWILFDNTGLKGEAAIWARKYIDGKRPPNLERYPVSTSDFQDIIEECTKVVYTVGFTPRTPPSTPQFSAIKCNDRNGIIAPGLFGLGIAYPEKVEDPFGNEELSVGLWKFMTYLNKVMPLWVKYAP